MPNNNLNTSREDLGMDSKRIQFTILDSFPKVFSFIQNVFCISDFRASGDFIRKRIEPASFSDPKKRKIGEPPQGMGSEMGSATNLKSGCDPSS